MNLSSILPPSRGTVSAASLPGMIVNSLLVACQERPFKRLTGWRGMAPCIGGGRAWTCKLDARPGVYGVATADVTATPSGPQATLNLYYFPAQDEEILESMALVASYIAAQPGYDDGVRAFENWGDALCAFRIGAVTLMLKDDESALLLALSASERRRVISEDGVPLPDGGWLIAPGEAEEDLPERQLALPLFTAMGAALSLSLGEAPCRYGRTTTAPQSPSIPGREGHFRAVASSTLIDSLGWGDRPSSEALAVLLPGGDNTALAEADQPEDIRTALWWRTHDLAALATQGEHAAAFDMRPRLIVLSGFLGAGKTTFLNQLLEYHAARDEMVAIIQNEIGETGVDGKLLQGDDSIVELDEGCVCCTLAGSLARGIERLMASYSPETIVLEATGLANPFNLLDEIGQLRHLVRFDSVTTLVDAANAAVLDDTDIARNQVRAADIILVNKCDLVSADALGALKQRIRDLNSRAPLVETTHAQMNPGLLYNDDPTQTAPGLMPSVPEHSHGSHADEGFSAARFTYDAPLPRAALTQALSACPADIFRIKGIVRCSDAQEPLVVQYVAGRYDITPLGDGFDDTSFLVAIGRNPQASGLDCLPGAIRQDTAQ